MKQTTLFVSLTLTPPPSGITIRGKSWSVSTAGGLFTNSGRTLVAGRLRRLAWECEACLKINIAVADV